MFVFQFLLIKHSLSERSHVIKLSWSNVIRTKEKNPAEFSKLNSFLHYRKLFLHICVFLCVWSKKMWLIKQFKMISNALIKNPKRAITKTSWRWKKKDKIRIVAEFWAREGKFYLSNIFWSSHKKIKVGLTLTHIITRLKWKLLKQTVSPDNKRRNRETLRPISTIAKHSVSENHVNLLGTGYFITHYILEISVQH